MSVCLEEKLCHEAQEIGSRPSKVRDKSTWQIDEFGLPWLTLSIRVIGRARLSPRSQLLCVVERFAHAP